MFITNVETSAAGAFSGPMVVSMRPIPAEKVVRAVQVTTRFPAVHGSPVHIGDPGRDRHRGHQPLRHGRPGGGARRRGADVLGLRVTPQAVAMSSKPPLMITHAPGHMFITDARDEDLSVL